MPRPLTDEEIEEVQRWLDGDLDPAEEAAFEQRLADDAAFAAAVAPTIEFDLWLAEVRPPDASARRAFSGPRWLVAAAVLLAAAAWLGRDVPPRLAFDVAALPSDAVVHDYRERLGLDPTTWPTRSGPGTGGGPRGPGGAVGPGQRVPPETFEREVDDADRRRADAAFASARHDEVEAGHFRVPVRVSRRAHALVLGVAASGDALRFEPRPGASPPPALEPGATRWLPAPAVRVLRDDEGPLADYDEGYLVPRGVERLTVVVGLRTEPLDADTLAAVDAALGPPPATTGTQETRKAGVDRLRRLLDARGFSTRTLEIVEPPH